LFFASLSVLVFFRTKRSLLFRFCIIACLTALNWATASLIHVEDMKTRGRQKVFDQATIERLSRESGK